MSRKNIEKQERPKDTKSAVLSVAAMLSSLGVGGMMLSMVLSGGNTNSSQACVTFGFYILTILCIIALIISSFNFYTKTHSMRSLFRSLISGICLFLSIMFVKVALALFFSGINKPEIVEKLVSDSNYNKFIINQSSGIICLIISIMILTINGCIPVFRRLRR